MIRKISLCLTAALVALSLSAQTSYQKRYQSLLSRVGAAGVGMETLLTKWEADEPDNIEMLKAWSDFHYIKARSTSIVTKPTRKYLGQNPLIESKDSLGNAMNYFQENNYVDSLLAKSFMYMDKAIALDPLRLDLRMDKITTLIDYEKESPDMAIRELLSLVDYNQSAHPQWKGHTGEAVSQEDFDLVIQDYCVALFSIGSVSSQEAFRKLSERMNKYRPDNPSFITNIGSYYLATKEYKTALKYYEKTLKIKPDDYLAIKNCVTIGQRTKNVKLLKKYLPLLAKYGSEIEKRQAEALLSSL